MEKAWHMHEKKDMDMIYTPIYAGITASFKLKMLMITTHQSPHNVCMDMAQSYVTYNGESS